MPTYDYEERIAAAKRVEYQDPHGARIIEGGIYWDNNLDAVKVTEVAASVEGPMGDNYALPRRFVYPESEVAWHKTERCRDGRRSSSDAGQFGRLVECWDGISAEAAVREGYYSVAEARGRRFHGTCQVCLARDAYRI